MPHSPAPLHLTRRDPSCNMSRFYALSLEPTLFGEVMLIRTWGRIGTSGQVKVQTFTQPAEAIDALDRLRHQKLKRGYRAEGNIADA
ncbi:WGR domain-containing protein [Donghicola sp. C2-DW-16]|uniref:WGR domain-containing protein n=1 Tax=Donghicola mangrovi TaxID=2729614 RepID=A0ABX2PLF7_9RHOB|nr:WGR domain-containing protein [Donghicola mangrovi]NVO29522.1 WGR domain-containing protein [Donghicola mangrovi]